MNPPLLTAEKQAEILEACRRVVRDGNGAVHVYVRNAGSKSGRMDVTVEVSTRTLEEVRKGQ